MKRYGYLKHILVVMTNILYLIFCCIFAYTLCLNELYAYQSMGYRPRYHIVKQSAFLVIGASLLIVTEFTWVGVHISLLALLLGTVFELQRYLRRRTKFKFTHRGIRLTLACVTVATVLILFSSTHAVVTCACCYSLFFLINFLLNKIEHARNLSYAKKLVSPLFERECLKIVITGSYGKTSVKNILKEILKEKYTVVATEGNLNTPIGIGITVQKHINTIENPQKPLVFIAEAGARRKGDVMEICNLLQPSYGIITGVSAQHLESFGSVHTVAETKAELLEYVGADGVMSFNGLNPIVLKLSSRFKGKNVVVGRDLTVEDLAVSESGTTFTLSGRCFNIPLKTSLLGSMNAVNVALAVGLALELNISREYIKSAVERLKPVPHRLELSKAGDVFILDDSYNANVEGVKSALEVVSAFSGRKIVYAQGIVECGKKAREINREVGRLVAGCADVVLLSGENARHVLNGLRDADFKGEVRRYKNLMHAKADFKNILKGGDVLLLQNDIP